MSKFDELVGKKFIKGNYIKLRGKKYFYKSGVFKINTKYSFSQEQTKNFFFKLWRKAESIKDNHFKVIGKVMNIHYPNKKNFLDNYLKNKKDYKLLDAGCGSWAAGSSFYGDYLNKLKIYLLDISKAIYQAKKNLESKGNKAICFQASLENLPFENNYFDIVFCPYVLPHLDNVKKGIEELSRVGKPGALYIMFCTRKPTPIRSIIESYTRKKIRSFKFKDAIKELRSLTEFAKSISAIKEKILIKRPLKIFNIPKGKYTIHKLFYDYLMRLVYRKEVIFESNFLSNLDWYVPSNYHGLDPEVFLSICKKNNIIAKDIKIIPGSTSFIGFKK